jgi:predicted amidohydrolase
MSTLKIALCQFRIRKIAAADEWVGHIRAQALAAAESRPDLIVFPEYVTFGMLSLAGAFSSRERGAATLKYLGGFTRDYETVFSELARTCGCLIAGGSHWTPSGTTGCGCNTAYLFHPDGRIDRQPKNHLYPNEAAFGTEPFDGLSVIETPKARIGLMTCYDAEFPEVARHFTLSGAQALICPAATNTVRGFYRVRHCCAARAVENQVFVAVCHAVGSLSVPTDAPFTGYGRSAILAPIDDQTRTVDGVVVEAPDPEEESIVVGEIDLALLQKSRESSEATILKTRRPDLYRRNYRLF